MKKWGILGAMELEVEALTAAMTDKTVTEMAGQRYVDGVLGGRPVTVVQCGIGKVRAAIGAQILIDRFHIDALINTGIAGGLAPGLRVGDLVVCTDAVQHDFDVTALDGGVRGYMCTGDDPNRPTRYAADKTLRRRFEAAAAKLPNGARTVEGTIATGDVFVADGALKQELHERYGAAAAEMEGGAVAQTAAMNGVPFLIVRAISDLADGGAPVSFEQIGREAAAQSVAILQAMVAMPDDV